MDKMKSKGEVIVRLNNFILINVIAAACLLLFSHGLLAADEWQFEVTPYLWAPNIDGTLNYDIPSGSSASPGVTVGPADYLEHLEMAGMITAGVRKGKWSVFTDFIYLDFGVDNSSVNSVQFTGPSSRVSLGTALDTGTSTSLEGLEWTLAGGYGLLETEKASLDAFGGFRYFDVEFKTDWNLSASVSSPVGGLTFNRSGSISQGEELWDVIVGARGRINLGNRNWYLPYYLDIGTGSSDFTWQGVLGLAYAFESIDIKLVYRHLYYDTSCKLIDDMRFSGPAFGATFKF
jgi:hypothetical protein